LFICQYIYNNFLKIFNVIRILNYFLKFFMFFLKYSLITKHKTIILNNKKNMKLFMGDVFNKN